MSDQYETMGRQGRIEAVRAYAHEQGHEMTAAQAGQAVDLDTAIRRDAAEAANVERGLPWGRTGGAMVDGPDGAPWEAAERGPDVRAPRQRERELEAGG